MLRQAVERNFEIIGEALNRLRRADAPIAARISAVDQIIAFRNILIHGYDLVEHDKVWGVIQDDLPRLAAEIRELLAP